MSKATTNRFKAQRTKHYSELRQHEAEVEAEAKVRKLGGFKPATVGDTLRAAGMRRG